MVFHAGAIQPTGYAGARAPLTLDAYVELTFSTGALQLDNYTGALTPGVAPITLQLTPITATFTIPTVTVKVRGQIVAGAPPALTVPHVARSLVTAPHVRHVSLDVAKVARVHLSE